MQRNNKNKIKKRLFIIVNVDWFFLSHRLPIAIAAQQAGFDVTVISKDTGHRDKIEKFGLKFVNLNFERTRVNFFNEFKNYRDLRKLYKKGKPDIVHHVTLKPIILGCIAAKVDPKIAIVNAVSGLGIMFSKKGSKIKRFLTLQILKKAFHIKNQIRVIFQNNDDRQIFLNFNLIKFNHSILIKGSGIDLDIFNYSPPFQSKIIKVLIAARMLYSKGFDEFSQAAALITNSGQYPNVKFEMAGDLDLLNPSGIPEMVIRNWEKKRNVIWLGHIADMKSKIIEADIIVFPSYYGEGVPKFLIESCAIGRPIVTTNHPGCRDCVDDNISGYLVEPRNPKQLANKIKILLENAELRKKFGEKARIKAELEFSIDQVIAKTLILYEEILNESH